MQILGWLLLPISMALFRYTGTIAALLMAAQLNMPAAWFVAGAIVVVKVVMEMTRYFRRRKLDNDLSRVISQDEMLELIRSRAIPYFAIGQSGHVGIAHSFKQDGATVRTTIFADPGGYPAYVSAYVAAANDVRQHRGHVIAYFNRSDSLNGPRNTSSRWITVDEATTLLRDAEIVTFTFGDGSERQRVPATDDPTGIMLIEYGWIRHLVVDPALATMIIPTTLEAQRRHSKPKFLVNGYYE